MATAFSNRSSAPWSRSSARFTAATPSSSNPALLPGSSPPCRNVTHLNLLFPQTTNDTGACMRNQVIALLTALILALAVMVGCSQNRANQPSVKENVEKSLDQANLKDVK